MHSLNVLILGPASFTATLNELNNFLKFNPLIINKDQNFDIILFHENTLDDDVKKNFIRNSSSIKICASENRETLVPCDAILELPTSVKELNFLIENILAKKKFTKNSSIKIKDYLLNKNEKKLLKSDEFIILTEKEIQLLELLLNNNDPISKDKILSAVWNYAAEADTHTVETHIYRLRRKISEKFLDDKFIFNSKDCYYL